jgi:sn-glycerol 3-phosphate transport system ATP-binding protein
VALLGTFGCGKSTTLRLIAGLETASAGTITIADREVTALPPAKRGVSMVFQNYALFPHLSVAENILFGLKVRDVPKAERDARLHAPPASSGSRRCSSASPRSSPAASSSASRSAARSWRDQGLPDGRAALQSRRPVARRDAARDPRLQRRLGMTMLYVTHDQVEAMTMADQVVLMRNGRIEQDAAPAALYEKPATIFAARFVGTPPMNVIPAALVPADWRARTGRSARHARGRHPARGAQLGADGVPATSRRWNISAPTR